MKIQQTQEIQSFAERVLPFLEAQPAAHNLILAVIEQLRHPLPGIQRSAPVLITVEADGEVQAIAIQTAARPLMLSRARHRHGIDAIAHHIKTHWSKAAVPLGKTLPSFSGPQAEAACFARAMGRWTGLNYQIKLAMGIHQLQQVRSIPQPEGKLRQAVAGDRPLLIHWSQAFEQEVFGGLQGDSAIWADHQLAQGHLFLWDIGSRATPQPVCLVGGNAFWSNKGRIGPVYTPPEQRRRGYAAAAVAALSNHLLDQGCQVCYLFTELANLTSNHIYQMIGYEPVCYWDEYQLHGDSN